MKKYIKKIPYKNRIAIAILIFTLFPCSFLEVKYFQAVYPEWKQNILIDYYNEVNSCAIQTSKTITELEAKMRYLLNNFEIRAYLAQLEHLPLSQALDFIVEIEQATSSLIADNENLAVRWYPCRSTKTYGNYCYTLDQFIEEFPQGQNDENYQEISSLDEGSFLWKIRTISRQINNSGAPQSMLCLYSQITNINGSDCILEFSIPITALFESSVSDPVLNSLFAICLRQNNSFLNIILSAQLSMTDSDTLLSLYQKNGKLSGYEIINSSISNVPDSEVLYFFPEDYVADLIRPKITSFISMSALIAVAVFGASYLTSYLLTRKIISAINSMNIDLDSIINEPLSSDYNHDDIGQIALRVRKLIQDTQDYCQQIEQYEKESLRAELELLQLRFNPHLLYNTLDTIQYQVKDPDVRKSITSLCGYYRIVLNNGHQIIRIKDEIDMIKEYFNIVKFAYGLNNITCEFVIEEQVLKYAIIKHLLQPIVENALNHGIRPTGQGGTIGISVATNDDCIYIQVKDTGVGMSKEEAARLLEEPAASVTNGGYGIYNVQQRIRVYYGEKYGLQIASEVGKGTSVTIKIPKILHEPD